MTRRYPIAGAFAERTWCTPEQYEKMYRQSLQEPEAFWAEQAQRIDWIAPWHRVKSTSFDRDVTIRWFEGGKLNAAFNCLDRHLASKADQPALVWEGDEPSLTKVYSYRELHAEVCRLGNALRDQGVQKGDRVTLYLPMVPELLFAVLACARIGAIHSVVFGGFSPISLANRIQDCDSDFVITADEGVRGGRHIPLKANVDRALESCPNVRKVLVVKRTGVSINFDVKRDLWYHELTSTAADQCAPEMMDAEDPLFILYTSGSTGKPKGLLHTTGGYLVYASLTHQVVFDYRVGDIYWCTADIGWITGHSYIVYGPLANGATTVMFEGIPTHPSPSRFWEICDKHRVNIFYTAPTALRALMRLGDNPLQTTTRDSLRLLGSVGEPINPEAWEWYHRVVGKGRCPVVDTWWQTETGGIMITPLPGAMELKPGSASKPFFGVRPGLVNDEGKLMENSAEGNLVLLDSWPGQARTIYGDHQRFIDTYFKTYPGMYFTGDGARRDDEGDYWVTGRVDDVINVAGHRIGTAELESALVAHSSVAEAAVVGYPHPVKFQGIYVYVTLKEHIEPSDTLRQELIAWVRDQISPIVTPDIVQWAAALPKTRSGKIMRRILRKIAANEFTDLGDTSTLLAEPNVVETLIQGRASL